VTLWYRAPELLLGASYHSPAVDAWALGCLLAELLRLAPLFPGRDAPQAGFQADQMHLIVSLLGPPVAADWPELPGLPHYRDAVSRWPLSQFPPPVATPAELGTRLAHLHLDAAGAARGHAAAASSLGNACVHATTIWPTANALDLLFKLLVYNPAKRLTVFEALSHPFFSDDLRCFPSPCVFATAATEPGAPSAVRHCSYKLVYGILNGRPAQPRGKKHQQQLQPQPQPQPQPQQQATVSRPSQVQQPVQQPAQKPAQQHIL